MPKTGFSIANPGCSAQSLAGGDYRSLAREVSVQFLHQLAVQGDDILDQLEGFLAEYAADERSRVLAQQWIPGTWSERERIDQMISSVSTNWELSRISLVDRSNLRLAIFQLLRCPDIPAKVVVNEAVELAKRFGSAQAPGFVNGILDAILRQTRENSNGNATA